MTIVKMTKQVLILDVDLTDAFLNSTEFIFGYVLAITMNVLKTTPLLK